MSHRLVWSLVAIVLLSAPAGAQQRAYEPLDLAELDAAIEPYRPTDPIEVDPRNRPFAILQTDLSPAWLIRCDEPEIVFFHDLPDWGLSTPTGLAFATAEGQSTVRRGSEIELGGTEMGGPWLIVFFDGGDGWDQFDVPWLLVLQHRPESVRIDADGLTMRFAEQAGLIGSMPLYGYYKCPRPDSDYARREGRVDLGVHTWQWRDELPEAVVDRAEWWSRHIRRFPFAVDETFSIDPGADSITIDMQFTYMTSEDDWQTEPLTAAPVPPTLGLAHLAGWETLSFSEAIHDPQLATPFGPYLVVENRDSYRYTLDGILRYIHEIERHTRPTHPVGREAMENLNEWMANRVAHGQQYWPPWGMGNLVWSTSGADFVLPKLIDYVDEPLRQRVIDRFDPWMQNYLLAEQFTHEGETIRFWLQQDVGNKTYFYNNGPGIGGDVFGDGGKLANNALYTFWCYAHYMDRWDVVAEAWPRIRRTILTPLSQDWKSVGRYAIAEMGDECQPLQAAARLAYGLGDADTYAYACYAFARQSVHHYVKHAGGDYFRSVQPMNRPDEVSDPLYLTNLLGHTMGWSLGGPGFGSTQWTNRYVRFNDEDIGRMHREQFGDFSRWELDHMQQLWQGVPDAGHTLNYSTDVDNTHNTPSIQRLRSFILDEPIDQLMRFAPLDAMPSRHIGYPMVQFAYIRASVDRQYDRLIPAGGAASPFVLGKQRDPGPHSPALVQMGAMTKYWPVPTWYGGAGSWQRDLGWRTPQENLNYGTGAHFAFGAIQPGLETYPRRGAVNRLNWVSHVLSWDISRTPPVNLAAASRGSVASVSDMENNFYQPTRLNDGDMSTGWSSNRHNDRTEAHWIAVELPAVETFLTLAAHTSGGARIDRIEVSTDGRSFRPVEPLPYEMNTEVRFAEPVQARVVRVHFAPNRHMTCNELELFPPED